MTLPILPQPRRARLLCVVLHADQRLDPPPSRYLAPPALCPPAQLGQGHVTDPVDPSHQLRLVGRVHVGAAPHDALDRQALVGVQHLSERHLGAPEHHGESMHGHR